MEGPQLEHSQTNEKTLENNSTPESKSDVLFLLKDWAAKEKRYNHENGYSVSSEPLSHNQNERINNDPEYKKQLEENHAELVESLKKEAEIAQDRFEEELKATGLTLEDPDIDKINADISYWQ